MKDRSMSRTEGVQDRDPVSPLMWTYRKVWLQSSGWADCTAGLLSSVKWRGPERTERGQTSALWRRLHQPASLKRNSANLNNNFFLNSTTSSPPPHPPGLPLLPLCTLSLRRILDDPSTSLPREVHSHQAGLWLWLHTHTHTENQRNGTNVRWHH